MRHQPARHVELREGARAAARGLISVVRGGQRVGVGAGALRGVGAVRERVRVAALLLAIIGLAVVTFRPALRLPSGPPKVARLNSGPPTSEAEPRPREAEGAAAASSGRLRARPSEEAISGLRVRSSERSKAALGAAASSSW